MKILYECPPLEQCLEGIGSIAILIALLVLSFIFLLLCILEVSVRTDQYVAFFAAILNIILAIAVGILCCDVSNSHDRIYAYLEEDASFADVDSKYKVIEKRGDLYVLKKKESEEERNGDI